jgi:tripartite ATP-independent transporter DctP family solute receptor
MNMRIAMTRRSFLAGAAAPALAFAQSAQRGRADVSFVQYHNQTAESSLHRRLSEMWTAIKAETRDRVEAQVFPGNNSVAGSDPAALKMLVNGEIQFFTLMGGILGTLVPVAEIQQVPFVFRSAPHAHQAMDGALGAYVRAEMAAKGIHGFAVGAFDNGMRQIAGTRRPIAAPGDLMGIRMRVPAGEMVADTFRAFGAEPITINSNAIYEALATGKVDAQENPLALIDLFKLYEVTRFVSMTNHMWSGFNMLAHLPTWNRLPDDVKSTIDRNVAKYVRLQREDQERANARLRAELTKRGLAFNDVDQAPFRKQLAGFYAKWRERLGTKAWSLMEQAT